MIMFMLKLQSERWNMKVFIYTEPDYKGTLWCVQSVDAISQEAAKKRYPVVFINDEDIEKERLDILYEGEKNKVVLYIGNSVYGSARTAGLLASHGIHPVLLNNRINNTSFRHSGVMLDYVEAMRICTDYLHDTGLYKTALFGINPGSGTDMIKRDYFCAHISSEADVFYNREDIDGCCLEFISKIASYKSAVCANDIVAYCLVEKLKAYGKRIPEDISLISFGDSVFSSVGSPTLTTVSVKHRELARQALNLYYCVIKASDKVSFSAKISPTIFLRESTPSITCPTAPYTAEKAEIMPENNFYNDDAAIKMLNFEKMLSSCDALELFLLSCLMKNLPYSEMAEKFYISEGSVFYHIKKMCRLAGLSGRDELAAAAVSRLSEKAISGYLEKLKL